MKLDDSKLRDALKAIHGDPLSRAEAAAIVDVARFAASVDGRMDMGEMATVARLSKVVYAMSGEADAPVPSTPVAAGALLELAKTLASSGSRELAYASARLLVLVDRKVTNEETNLVATLTQALRIDAARAEELDRLVDALVRGAG